MNIHEFGKENKETLLLIHPSIVKWDYFDYVVPLLEKKYHLLIPALPGYDSEDDSDFTSVEQIAMDLNDWLKAKCCTELFAVYGCSMGGSIALMVALGQRIPIRHCIMDGGITPYQLPWIVTRLIALTDYPVFPPKPNMEEVKRALTLLENHSVIQRLEGKFNQSSCKMAILPTILSAVPSERLSLAVSVLRKEEADEEAEEDSAD